MQICSTQNMQLKQYCDQSSLLQTPHTLFFQEFMLVSADRELMGFKPLVLVLLIRY